MGDDLRQIDWNLYGRLDEFLVKRFAGESEIEIDVVLDRSASMSVGSPTKDVFARRLAAGVAAGFAGEGRIVTVRGWGEDVANIGPTIRTGADLERLLAALENLVPPIGRVHPQAPVAALATTSRRSRLVVFIADFLDDESLAAPIALRRRRADVMALVPVAEEERRPPVGANVLLVGIEGEGKRRVHVDDDVAERYRRAFEARLAELAATARSHAIPLREVASERPFDAVLVEAFRAGAFAS